MKLQTRSWKFVPLHALTAGACLLPIVTSLGAVAVLFDHIAVEVGVSTVFLIGYQELYEH